LLYLTNQATLLKLGEIRLESLLMAGHGKYYELLDMPKFAAPDVLTLKAEATAFNLMERVGGGGFMSYGQIWPRFDVLVRGFASDAFIDASFAAYKAEWKNNAIRAAYRLLRDHFGGKGQWYRMPIARIYVLGCWFKTSIRGFWVYDGKVYAALINCRKSQPLSINDVRFLARGVYELYCIDDPNNPIPLIVDLGEHSEDQVRKSRVYEMPVGEAISLEAFESSVREFLSALSLAGISSPPPPDVEHILDLFRR
jgi:hypothetical protein